MRIMTIIGTRPEIIRLSLVTRLLDLHAEHILVHTGQNYDDRLNGLFFRELSLREPDVVMSVHGASFAEQIGNILVGVEPLFHQYRPDRLLILGDTNSGLSALVARRMGIPIYHMEAGNRCFDDRVPEETNRRVIDHSSSILLPYTHRSKENLLHEGIPGQRIYVVGNPIKEVMDVYSEQIRQSTILDELEILAGKFFLVTLHRAENVDLDQRLATIFHSLGTLAKEYGYPVICSFHPRTKAKAEAFHLDTESCGVRCIPPLGFFDFVRLEQAAFCTLTDSGTVQEETCIMRVPNVTIRDVTERPETIECGSNLLSDCDAASLLSAVAIATQQAPIWNPPVEYLATGVANHVARILLGHRIPDLAEARWASTSRSNE
ncbi:MAG: non-hydrolyzing UDP-N-acetylglucosamine 2-epimerase [Armatimonadota bacterium]